MLGAAPAARLVEAHETVHQGLAGHGLHLRVEGGADEEAALVEALLAVALGDVAADALGEVADAMLLGEITRGLTVRGSFLAAAAASAVTPLSTMRSITQLRRSMAACRWRKGW